MYKTHIIGYIKCLKVLTLGLPASTLTETGRETVEVERKNRLGLTIPNRNLGIPLFKELSMSPCRTVLEIMGCSVFGIRFRTPISDRYFISRIFVRLSLEFRFRVQGSCGVV
jgi:hypothetical protein